MEYERLCYAISNFFRFRLIVLVTDDEHGVNMKILVVLESNSSYRWIRGDISVGGVSRRYSEQTVDQIF